MAGTDQCPDHPTVLRLFCTDCRLVICPYCWKENHDGHNTSSLSGKMFDIENALNEAQQELATRRGRAVLVTKELRHQMAEAHTRQAGRTAQLEEKHLVALQDVEKEFEARKTELQKVHRQEVEKEKRKLRAELHDLDVSLTQASEEAKHLASLMDSLALPDTRQSLGVLADVLARVKVELDKTSVAQIAALQAALLPLLEAADQPREPADGDVAVTAQYLDTLRNFARNRYRGLPGPPQCPTNAGAAYKGANLRLLPEKTARGLTRLLGDAALALYEWRPGGGMLRPGAAPDAKDTPPPSHVRARIIEQQPGEQSTGSWFLPTSLPVREALHLALGYSPARVQDRRTGQRVDDVTVDEWFSTAGFVNNKGVCVWRAEPQA